MKIEVNAKGTAATEGAGVHLWYLTIGASVYENAPPELHQAIADAVGSAVVGFLGGLAEAGEVVVDEGARISAHDAAGEALWAGGLDHWGIVRKGAGDGK